MQGLLLESHERYGNQEADFCCLFLKDYFLYTREQ